MKSPSLSQARKYLSALKKCKGNYVTADKLSELLGYYPEVVSEFFSFFEPMVTMDYEYNLRDLEKPLEDYIEQLSSTSKPIINREDVVTKKDLSEYESINDFIFKNMTSNGMFIKNYELSDYDLRVLKKLISAEQAERKKK